jgi:hypothetical protein
VAADRDDEPGVLGNLPRSRPGRRSDKRGGAGARPAAKRATASRSSAGSQRSNRATTTARKTAPPRRRPQPSSRSSSSDPISQAVQLAGKVAAVGVKTAAGIIKRLPGG